VHSFATKSTQYCHPVTDKLNTADSAK